ncbi:MAG: hypothetical protein GXP46_11870, partial [Deferribacteres bacterium]|nr:hypothetical protein [Deferribacteres bacterium]
FEPGARVSLLSGGPFLMGSSDLLEWKDAYRVYKSGSYAYVAGKDLNVFDISDPASPARVGGYSSVWEIRDVYVYGDYAYLIAGMGSLEIMDVRDPANPVPADIVYYGDHEGGYVTDLFVSGGYLYAAMKSEVPLSSWPKRQAGLKIIDISDPVVHVSVSFYETGPDVRSLYVQGDLVYAMVGSELWIFDVTDPSTPVLAGTFTDDVLASFYSPAPSILVSGGLAYIAGAGTLSVVDVSDPAAPVLAGRIDILPASYGGAYEIQISSNYAFISAGGNGLNVVDVSDPERPVFAGLYGRRSNDVYVEDGYAYVAAGESLQVLDISSPVIPVFQGFYLSEYGAYGVHASGDYAYLTTYYLEDYYDYTYQMDMIDVSNPGLPVKTDDFSMLVCSPEYRGITPDVFVQEGYAYLAFGPFGLEVVDVSNPAALYVAGYLYDIGDAISVHVSGNHAYVLVVVDRTFETVKRLRIIDISNPLESVLVSSAYVSGSSNDLYVTGDLAYVADGKAGLRIIDVSNPEAPVFVSSHDTPGMAYGVYAYGGYAYVADGKAGLQVIDVSDPSAPVLVGGYNTSGLARAVYVSGRYAYVADGDEGLQVIDVSDPHEPYLADSVPIPGVAHDVYVSGDYTFVTSTTMGIIILKKKVGAVTDVEVVGPDTITATFPAGLPVGPYHILVTNPGGQTEEGYLYNGFTVVPPTDTDKCKGPKGCGKRDELSGKGQGNR